MSDITVTPKSLVANPEGSGSPTAAAAAMGQSLDALGALIIQFQSNFADLGSLLAKMKSEIADLSQRAQDNFSRTGDQNNNSTAVGGNTIDYFLNLIKSGQTLSSDDAGYFSALQQQLSSIVNSFQSPDNKLAPLLTACQNTTQSLPSEFAQILSGDSAPMVQGQQTITQLLEKGL